VRLLLASLLLCCSAVAQTQFEFDAPALNPPHWGIELDSDGHGVYWEPGPDGRSSHRIEVGKATLTKIDAGRKLVTSGKPCETKARNIAHTGTKTLRYADRSCTFNFSDDAGVMGAQETFRAVAETIQMGAQLERRHRFDRLGLDADMTSLASEVKEGRAAELGNIAPLLQSIVDDGEVLQRVRLLAARLLALVPPHPAGLP
jgi:hypothetical protein